MSSVVTWSPGMSRIGPAVLAMGVFDGVHLGHRALLAEAAREAANRGFLSVVLTFDRDPDRLVRGTDAPPHLMEDRTRIETLASSGAGVALVVPFTPELLATPAESFLENVVWGSLDVRSVHVGEDFRFGAGARGDLDTLYVWAAEHDIDVHPHPLLKVDDTAVSSTRIRTLIARGDVEGASSLLDRPHEVTGRVHRGRGEGRELGFPTANLTPSPGAALPSDGVYAGTARLADGTRWPAAIVVGRPPTFPEAQDHFEVHLIGFEGDLVGAVISVSFLARLRDQRAFGSLDALRAAIREDVAGAAHIAAARSVPFEPSEEDHGHPLVDDPIALEAAERAAARMPDVDQVSYTQYEQDWVPVFGPIRLSSLFSDGGASSSLITGRLAAEGIPFVWDPFPPSHAQTSRPDFNWLREFTLLVPPDRADDARNLLAHPR